jgi:hypothetical protein
VGVVGESSDHAHVAAGWFVQVASPGTLGDALADALEVDVATATGAVAGGPEGFGGSFTVP